MEKYIAGCEFIKAEPMSLGAYNQLRGWMIPVNECPTDEGYLVEYLGNGKANHPGFNNYISWSPKDVFENSYRKTDSMTFGLALEAIKHGKSIKRKDWPDDSTMYIKNGLLLGISDLDIDDVLAEDWMVVCE